MTTSELQARARFARKLPRRVASLQRLVQLGGTPRNSEAIEPARREAHNLAGTSGSYGYGEVSRRARDLEDALKRVLAGDAPASDWGRVTEALRALATEVEALDAAAEPAAASAETTRPRILFADADSEARRLAEEVGARSLWDVVTVADPTAALDLATAERWDAVVVDGGLGPEADPFRLAREIRNLPNHTAIPLAVMSRMTTMPTRVAAAHAGAALFLAKPVSRNGLSDGISTLVSLRRETAPRVLAVDDDEDFLARLTDLLHADGIEVHTLSDTRQILDAIRDLDPDALLLDYDMPGFNGVELCATVRADRRIAELPILFVTSHDDDQTRLAAFSAGCDDYFLKQSVSPVELRARVRSRVDRSRLTRARAERDALTGLSLRSVFVASLENRLSEAIRRGQRLAVCLIDLDHFKHINDQYGHLAGDRVLAAFGRLLASRFRGEDLRARWGGEEFALAFPGENADTIYGVMVRVLEELTNVEFEGDRGETFRVSFSAGVADYPRDGQTVESLLRSADQRLFLAKHEGRCRVETAPPRPERD